MWCVTKHKQIIFVCPLYCFLTPFSNNHVCIYAELLDRTWPLWLLHKLLHHLAVSVVTVIITPLSWKIRMCGVQHKCPHFVQSTVYCFNVHCFCLCLTECMCGLKQQPKQHADFITRCCIRCLVMINGYFIFINTV